MKKAEVAVVMGSESDFKVMKDVLKVLKQFKAHYICEVVSAHRTPDLLEKKVNQYEKAGIKVIVAGAGGAAHLPGMLASFSILPVIGVPIKTKNLDGLDSLLSIAQMPPGIPVATMAVNGAQNAGLLSVKILALIGQNNHKIKLLRTFKTSLKSKVKKMQKSVSRKTKKI